MSGEPVKLAVSYDPGTNGGSVTTTPPWRHHGSAVGPMTLFNVTGTSAADLCLRAVDEAVDAKTKCMLCKLACTAVDCVREAGELDVELAKCELYPLIGPCDPPGEDRWCLRDAKDR